MLESIPNPEAGQRLRAERMRAGLSTREVQKLSQQIAQEKNHNQDYSISHAWLTEVENGRFTPSIYKLYSLSLIYKCTYAKILGFFGINLLDAPEEQKLVGLPETRLIGSGLELAGQKILLPTELRQNVDLERTNLVSRMFESWGEIPVSLLPQLDLRHHFFGYVGLEDSSMYPVIRPGSFVEIDARQKRVAREPWKDEFERPVYFVELRDRYACRWCELDGNHLVLVPSPHSGAQIQRVRYRSEAEILGRVMAVTMGIAVQPEGHHS
jgi:transcriptional regulator with XRE-family HTH domain